MATEVKSQQDYYDIAKDEMQTIKPELTDFIEGAVNDVFAGVLSVAASEVSKLIVDKFNKTFINTAHGPEVTGGSDDLQILLTDHFGPTFARPAASPAIGIVTFSRPTIAAGNVSILAGTIVKTTKNANGEEQRFSVVSSVTLTGLSINASVEAVVSGSDGNVAAASVTIVETALTDPTVVVTNALAFTGGAPEMNDADYREFARLKIEAVRGGTLGSIEAAADLVPGVEKVTAFEYALPVKEWDIGGNIAVGNIFYVPYVKVYIADANGTASQALIDEVEIAVNAVKAAGVVLEVLGATPLLFDWTATMVLNPSGPNFGVLNTDPSMIIASMTQYIAGLPIGTDFVRATADAAIMAIWGPAGTDDLTDFDTTQPVGDVSVLPTEKLVPDDIGLE